MSNSSHECKGCQTLERKFLDQEKRFLEQEKRFLEQEKKIKELEDKLNTNSTNSGISPSIDFKISRKKKIKKTKEKTGRSPGGQPGHKGNYREMVSNPDKIIEINQCSCGGIISGSAEDYVAVQKIEIPPIRPYVSEYRLKKGICNCCLEHITANLPEDVSPDLLGDHAKTIISTLTGYFKTSRREVKDILKNIFGLDISLGLVSKTEERVTNKCSLAYEILQENVNNSSLLNSDETSNNCKGDRGWTWVFANEDTTVIKWEDSRGMKVLEKNVPNFEGTVISDRYGAYNFFEKDKRQICWAHLARDFEKFSNSSFREVKKIGIYLKELCKKAFNLFYDYKYGSISWALFMSLILKIRRKIYSYLHRMQVTSESIQARRVSKNILKYEDMMWHFLSDPDRIPMTNNFAERQLRRFVIIRKTSFFTWSDRGKRFLECLLSIFQTCKQRALNPFEIISYLVSGKIDAVPYKLAQ